MLFAVEMAFWLEGAAKRVLKPQQVFYILLFGPILSAKGQRAPECVEKDWMEIYEVEKYKMLDDFIRFNNGKIGNFSSENLLELENIFQIIFYWIMGMGRIV